MILTDDRKALDTALGENVSICVLLGAENSHPGKVHRCMDAGKWGEEPWNRWFLITNPLLVTDDEHQRWFDRDPNKDYAFLGRTIKTTTSNGASENELLVRSNCDYLTYINKFAEADLQ